jgi:hypothetical protein
MFLVGVANDVILPPRDFDDSSGWHYKEYEDTKCDFRDVIHGISSVQNFNYFRPAIPWLRNSYRGTSIAKRQFWST